LNLHVKGNKLEAIKALSKAVKVNPELLDDPVVLNLTGEITGLSPAEAIASLLNKEQHQLISNDMLKRERGTISTRQMVSRILLGISLIVLTVLVIWFVRSGYLDRYLSVIQVRLLDKNKHRISGTEYYLIPPDGDPPVAGWPVVVALHGYGGSGRDLLPIADFFTSQGVLFISPTFGGYEPLPGDGPIEPMNDILNDARSRYPISAQGVVLYGFSQGGTFAYRYSVYQPDQVAGVVTAGAPDLEGGIPARMNMPYVFTWGEADDLQDFVLPIAHQIKSRGYKVETAIVQNAGHEVTLYSIDRTLEMINDLYKR
jgi:predicted esterase